MLKMQKPDPLPVLFPWSRYGTIVQWAPNLLKLFVGVVRMATGGEVI